MADTPALGTVSRASDDAVDTAVGGASIALDAVRHPENGIQTARRRGSRITSRLSEGTESAVDEVISLPERMLFSGLRALRTRARRSDVGGVAARSVLLMVHRPARSAARVLERIERETAPPAAADRRRRRSTTGTAAARPRGASRAPSRGASRGAPAPTRRTGTGTRAPRRSGGTRARRTA
jgi:hypothetical protein